MRTRAESRTIREVVLNDAAATIADSQVTKPHFYRSEEDTLVTLWVHEDRPRRFCLS